jgi:hypothetical protein
LNSPHCSAVSDDHLLLLRARLLLRLLSGCDDDLLQASSVVASLGRASSIGLRVYDNRQFGDVDYSCQKEGKSAAKFKHEARRTIEQS